MRGDCLALEIAQEKGGPVWVAEAPDWTGEVGKPLLIGITPDAVKLRTGRGLRHMTGQLYGVLGPGLIMAEHVFRGLKRDMRVRDDNNADAKKLAVTWAAPRDAVFAGGEFDGTLSFTPASKDRVFCVYISPNEMLQEFPSIFGWAEHWTWIAADPGTAGAPIGWRERYDSRIWTKSNK